MKTLFTGICEDLEVLHKQYGQDIVCTPLIEITEVEDKSSLLTTCEQIDQYDYLLFTSRFAVRHYIPLLPSIPNSLRVISIGKATTHALHLLGIKNVEQVDIDNSYGVIEWFRHQPCGRVLFPRSNIALPIIVTGLQDLGFVVCPVTAYVNRMPVNPIQVNIDEFGHIIFTSPSTVNHFVTLYGALPLDKELIARGPITQQAIINQLNKQK